MKKIIAFLLMLLLSAIPVHAQNVGINNPTPAVSSILDLTSTNKGLLIPRVTTAQRFAIPSPAYGLLVCDTTLNDFYFWDKTAWRPFLTSTSGWQTTGNPGTNPAINYLGTTDNQPLKVRVNNIPAGSIQPDGQTFLGINAGLNNTGVNNNAFGNSALKNNTFGWNNTATGYKALFLNSTGNYNSAFGSNVLVSNTTGNDNSAYGYNALFSNTTGVDNSAYGFGALFSNTTGGNNAAYGISALYNNTTGTFNSAFGSSALLSNTTGFSNVAFGSNTLIFSTTANNNSAFGHGALWHTSVGSDNTAIGSGSLGANTTGAGNVATGSGAISLNTTGTYNTAIGYACAQNNTIASFNTAVGEQAMLLNTTASENTAVGSYALNKQSFTNSNAPWTSENVAVGFNALYWNAPVSITTGNRNTGVGHSALKGNTTGSSNTALGFNAGLLNSTGINNTFIGANAGLSTGMSNSTAIGNNAQANSSNKIRLGDANVTVIEGQVAYSYPSDARFKFNIKNNIPGLDFIMKLKPVTYNFDTKKFEEHIIQNMPDSIIDERMKAQDFSSSSNIIHSGFLAQDIEQACKQSGYDFDGLHIPDAANKTDHYSVAYSQFIMPLVKGMQEQQSLINQQAKTISDLMSRIEKLESSK